MKARTKSKRQLRRSRGRPPASVGLIAARVHHLQRRDPARKLESIVADLDRDHDVKRATLFKALREYRLGEIEAVRIWNEALPRLQESEDAVTAAKVGCDRDAYNAAKSRHRDLCQQLEAEFSPKALDAIEIVRKLSDKKKAVELWREWQVYIKLMKDLGSPDGTDFEEILKLSGLEYRPSTVEAATKPRYYIIVASKSRPSPATRAAMRQFQDQIQELLQPSAVAVPGFDFEANAQTRKRLFDQRTDVNRRAKEYRTLADKVQLPPGECPLPINSADLLQALEDANKHNAGILQEKMRRTRLDFDLTQQAERAKQHRIRIAALRAEADRLGQDAVIIETL